MYVGTVPMFGNGRVIMHSGHRPNTDLLSLCECARGLQYSLCVRVCVLCMSACYHSMRIFVQLEAADKVYTDSILRHLENKCWF